MASNDRLQTRRERLTTVSYCVLSAAIPDRAFPNAIPNAQATFYHPSKWQLREDSEASTAWTDDSASSASAVSLIKRNDTADSASSSSSDARTLSLGANSDATKGCLLLQSFLSRASGRNSGATDLVRMLLLHVSANVAEAFECEKGGNLHLVTALLDAFELLANRASGDATKSGDILSQPFERDGSFDAETLPQALLEAELRLRRCERQNVQAVAGNYFSDQNFLLRMVPKLLSAVNGMMLPASQRDDSCSSIIPAGRSPRHIVAWYARSHWLAALFFHYLNTKCNANPSSVTESLERRTLEHLGLAASGLRMLEPGRLFVSTPQLCSPSRSSALFKALSLDNISAYKNELESGITLSRSRRDFHESIGSGNFSLCEALTKRFDIPLASKDCKIHELLDDFLTTNEELLPKLLLSLTANKASGNFVPAMPRSVFRASRAADAGGSSARRSGTAAVPEPTPSLVSILVTVCATSEERGNVRKAINILSTFTLAVFERWRKTMDEAVADDGSNEPEEAYESDYDSDFGDEFTVEKAMPTVNAAANALPSKVSRQVSNGSNRRISLHRHNRYHERHHNNENLILLFVAALCLQEALTLTNSISDASSAAGRAAAPPSPVHDDLTQALVFAISVFFSPHPSLHAPFTPRACIANALLLTSVQFAHHFPSLASPIVFALSSSAIEHKQALSRAMRDFERTLRKKPAKVSKEFKTVHDNAHADCLVMAEKTAMVCEQLALLLSDDPASARSIALTGSFLGENFLLSPALELIMQDDGGRLVLLLDTLMWLWKHFSARKVETSILILNKDGMASLVRDITENLGMLSRVGAALISLVSVVGGDSKAFRRLLSENATENGPLPDSDFESDESDIETNSDDDSGSEGGDAAFSEGASSKTNELCARVINRKISQRVRVAYLIFKAVEARKSVILLHSSPLQVGADSIPPSAAAAGSEPSSSSSSAPVSLRDDEDVTATLAPQLLPLVVTRIMAKFANIVLSITPDHANDIVCIDDDENAADYNDNEEVAFVVMDDADAAAKNEKTNGGRPITPPGVWGRHYPAGKRTLGGKIDELLSRSYSYLHGFTLVQVREDGLKGGGIGASKVWNPLTGGRKWPPENPQAAINLYRCIMRCVDRRRNGLVAESLGFVQEGLGPITIEPEREMIENYIYGGEQAAGGNVVARKLSDGTVFMAPACVWSFGDDASKTTTEAPLTPVEQEVADIARVRKGLYSELVRSPLPRFSGNVGSFSEFANVESDDEDAADVDSNWQGIRAACSRFELALYFKFDAAIGDLHQTPNRISSWLMAAKCLRAKWSFIRDRLCLDKALDRRFDAVEFGPSDARDDDANDPRNESFSDDFIDDYFTYMKHPWSLLSGINKCKADVEKAFAVKPLTEEAKRMWEFIGGLERDWKFPEWQTAWGGIFVRSLRTMQQRCLNMCLTLMSDQGRPVSDKLKCQILEECGNLAYSELQGSLRIGPRVLRLGNAEKKLLAEKALFYYVKDLEVVEKLKADGFDVNSQSRIPNTAPPRQLKFMIGKCFEKVASCVFDSDESLYFSAMKASLEAYSESFALATKDNEGGKIATAASTEQIGGSSNGPTEAFYRLHASRFKCLLRALSTKIASSRSRREEQALQLIASFSFTDEECEGEARGRSLRDRVWTCLVDVVAALAECRRSNQWFHRSVYRHAQALILAPWIANPDGFSPNMWHSGGSIELLRGPPLPSHRLKQLRGVTMNSESFDHVRSSASCISQLFDKRREQICAVWVTSVNPSLCSPFETLNQSEWKYDLLRAKYSGAFFYSLGLECKISSSLGGLQLLQKVFSWAKQPSTRRDVSGYFYASAMAKGLNPKVEGKDETGVPGSGGGYVWAFKKRIQETVAKIAMSASESSGGIPRTGAEVSEILQAAYDSYLYLSCGGTHADNRLVPPHGRPGVDVDAGIDAVAASALVGLHSRSQSLASPMLAADKVAAQNKLRPTVAVGGVGGTLTLQTARARHAAIEQCHKLWPGKVATYVKGRGGGSSAQNLLKRDASSSSQMIGGGGASSVSVTGTAAATTGSKAGAQLVAKKKTNGGSNGSAATALGAGDSTALGKATTGAATATTAGIGATAAVHAAKKRPAPPLSVLERVGTGGEIKKVAKGSGGKVGGDAKDDKKRGREDELAAGNCDRSVPSSPGRKKIADAAGNGAARGANGSEISQLAAALPAAEAAAPLSQEAKKRVVVVVPAGLKSGELFQVTVTTGGVATKIKLKVPERLNEDRKIAFFVKV